MAPTTGAQAQQEEGTPSSSTQVDAPSTPAEPPAPSPTSSSAGDNVAQTASTLEANLTSLENKLDAILASFGISEADLDALDEQESPKTQKEENGNGTSREDGKSA
ncbi:hypothetical protein C7999DRAFT_27580 [Corynascus novoguineensis]|uniref:Heat shock factor binding protein 1 n=1 Tax=Corynascus novoguineensis TaxID=1126955 RepID=A0AAN7HP33_9PEZI|nr:hypothetical protein C7999DRAFT_27580 [Corynascus novoguineensis]